MNARVVQFAVGSVFTAAGTWMTCRAWQTAHIAGLGKALALGVPGGLAAILGVLLLIAALVPASFWDRFVSAPLTHENGGGSTDRGWWNGLDFFTYW